jgi:hypothetical protein
MVGLIPLFAIETFEPELLARFPAFKRRLEWFVDHRPDLVGGCACMRTPGKEQRRLFSVVDAAKLRRVLEVMLDEREFLSPYGVRSLSRVHRERPFELQVDGEVHRVGYEPAESTSGLFGGNSNWRGPVWFPVNFFRNLVLFHEYFHGEDGSGLGASHQTGWTGLVATLLGHGVPSRWQT